MTDSLTAIQIEQIVKLGKWRDEGHCLAVSRYGEVSIHMADKGDNHVATEQREGAARRQGPSGRQGAAGQSGAAAPSESSGQDRSADLRQKYFDAMAEVREYYPDLRVIEVEDGMWVVTKILPIGRGGPSFSVCLFLSDNKAFDPKAFAFEGNGRRAIPVSLRHTNFPDASVCAYCADDGVWVPGNSPLVLLNLYAEWLLCQLFYANEDYWPGPQFGLSATYRFLQFRDKEWCDCGSRRRYVECHKAIDTTEVQRLRLLGEFQDLPDRNIPPEILTFARSGWAKAPRGIDLSLHEFRDQAEAERISRQRLPGMPNCAIGARADMLSRVAHSSRFRR